MQGKKHYTEKLFANFQLSDRVPQDNFYRKLKQLLDLHYLYKLTEKYYGTEGQASIDPVVFFKLILIGYLKIWVVIEESFKLPVCGWTCFTSLVTTLMRP